MKRNLFLEGSVPSHRHNMAVLSIISGYDIIEWKESLVPLRQTKAFFTTNKQTPYCRKMIIISLHTHLTSKERLAGNTVVHNGQSFFCDGLPGLALRAWLILTDQAKRTV